MYEYNLEQKMRKGQEIPQKGFMVGNGATDYILDVWPAYVPTLYNFQMIPKSLYDTFNANNCFFSFNDVLQDQPSQICIDTFNEINAMTTDHVNWYDLYRPVYPEALKRMKSEPRYGEVEINGEIKKYKRGKTIKEYTPWVKGANEDIILGMTLSDYINQQEVRTALNIDPKLTDPFELCSSKLKYSSEPEASKSMSPDVPSITPPLSMLNVPPRVPPIDGIGSVSEMQ